MIYNAGEQQATVVSTESNDEATKTRLNLLYAIGKEVGLVSQLARLVERVTQMTQRVFKAFASSVFLFSD